MAHRLGCHNSWRDGPDQSSSHPPYKGTGRTLRNSHARAGPQSYRTGTGRERPLGKNGFFMEVKPSHKLTEVGVIPADWDSKQIGDLNPFVTSGSRGWAAFYSDRGAPFIRITNLTRASIYM